MRKLKYILPIVAIAAVFSVAAGTTAQADKTEDNKIADRVYIGEVAVGGMTEEEALSALDEYVDDLSDDVITLTAGDYSVEATVADLGMTWAEAEERVSEAVNLGKTGNLIDRYKVKKDLENQDMVLPLVLTVDTDKTNAFIEAHQDELNNEAIDYGLKRENGSFTVIEGKTGVVVKIEDCVDTINAYYAAGWVDNGSIELPSEIEQPKGSAEELAKVKDVLGSFSTNFSSSAWGRAQNVKNATSLINGSLLYPGEEFSVYDAINPMTPENGYELAGSYENGATVETYGGGVCQVSTTLYNAVIRAELEVTLRYAHSMIVTYVEPSADAAIAGTYKNLKFVNNTDAPIYIEGYTNGGILYFNIFGEETRPSNREVSFISETTSTKEADTQFKATSAAVGTVTKVQSAHVGKTARLWKVVKVDGVEESREIFNNSTYMASPAIYEVGTSSTVKEATAAMKAAIKSKDLSTVKAAAAEWKNAEKKIEEEKKKEEEKTSDSDKKTDAAESAGTTDTENTGSSNADSGEEKTESAETTTEETAE